MPPPGDAGAEFIPAGAGGLLTPSGAIFGPDGNRDGYPDLYVSSCELTDTNGSLKAKGRTATVKRHDGLTGGSLDAFVPAGLELDNPTLTTLSATDPTTLGFVDEAGP